MDETSLEIVNAGEMYPKQSFTSDDGVLTVPFPLLCGEAPLYRGRSAEGALIVTSYRLYQQGEEGGHINVPLALIDCLEVRDILYLYVFCKDGRFFRCIFENAEEVQKWTKRIQSKIQLPQKIDACFAFRFLSWMREEQKDNIVSQTSSNIGDVAADGTYAEAERMGFDLKSVWKISTINENYDLCPSYPRLIITPSMLLDEEMRDLANFRYSNRIPAVVWRHQQNGCVIARSSQPKQGVWCWRNLHDEKLLDAISAACLMDPGYGDRPPDDLIRGDVDSDMSILYGQESHGSRKKLLIVDARSYAAAVTNRAKGGGYECDGYYPNCEVQYMGLANIHAIRNSFCSVRALCTAPEDASWLSGLESSKWLLHISGLVRASLLVVDAVDLERRPVLVHCSDGWDRTPQIVALAEIMLDPYYRTKKGFQTLVEREWLEFGHKFADRCGHADGVEDRNERSPVFLQWLDCVFQLTQQFPCHFEFNEQYLARLVLHTYSGLFGTFLCNTDRDRRQTHSIFHRTFSVWPVLNEKGHFRNYLYNHSTEVLRPSFQIRNLKFWSDVYFPNNSANLGRSTTVSPDEQPPETKPPVAPGDKTNLVKTKSCDNIHSPDHSLTLQRRRSDPNLIENFPPQTISVPNATASNQAAATLEGHQNVVDISGGNIEEDTAKSDSADPSEGADLESEGTCDVREGPSTETGDFDERTDAKTVSNLVLRPIDGSTDTLVSECGAIVQSGDCSIEMQPMGRRFATVATDTSDLIDAKKCPLPSSEEGGLQNWYRGAVGKRGGSWTCSYTTPNHSRTPSSGFPATPCDDPGEVPNLKKDPSSQIMEFDGMDFQSHAVQERLRKLILHYKNKVINISQELQYAKEELFQRIYSCPHGKEGCFIEVEDTPSLADSASSGDQPERESGGSESSWDLMAWTPDQGASHPAM